jgi:hypothetical protein
MPEEEAETQRRVVEALKVAFPAGVYVEHRVTKGVVGWIAACSLTPELHVAGCEPKVIETTLPRLLVAVERLGDRMKELSGGTASGQGSGDQPALDTTLPPKGATDTKSIGKKKRRRERPDCCAA